jgi:hypothetical protein
VTVRAPSGADLKAQRKRAAAVLSLAIPLGFALGRFADDVIRHALESGSTWLVLAIEMTLHGIGPIGTAGMAVTILRTVEAHKLWVAAGLLVLPVISTHSAWVYHPLIILCAELSWFLVVLACAREKRTFGIWCVAACAACTTGMQLESTAAKAIGLPDESQMTSDIIQLR